MAYKPLLENSPEQDISDLKARLARLEGLNTSTMPPARIGTIRFAIDQPSQLTGLVVNQGCEFLMNGASYSAALYPAFDDAWVDAGGTSGVLEDAIGRILVCCGSNASTVFGADDGVSTVSSRSPRHNTTNGLSLSGATVAASSHTHGPGSLGVNVTSSGVAGGPGGSTLIPNVGGASVTSGATGGPSATSTVSISGTVGPGGTLPTDTPAFGAFCWIYIRCL